MDKPPSCPRCGYDQSGAIAAWGRNDPPSCPLIGLCTECGLEFRWRDLLNPLFARQLQFFEHARRRTFRCFLLTWRKSARPWSFWRWVHMEYEVVPARLAAQVLLGVLLTEASLAGVAGTSTFLLDRWILYGPFQNRADAVLHVALPFGRHQSYGDLYESMNSVITPLQLISVALVLLMPGTFILIPSTLRRARVRKLHLLRVWAYGLIWIPVPFCTAQLARMVHAILYSVAPPSSWSSWFNDTWLERWGDWLTFAAVCAWLVLWWSMAAARYLRLPHALAIGLVMTGLAMLIAMVLTLLIGGHWMMYSL